MMVAPRSFAFITHRKPTGWASAMDEPSATASENEKKGMPRFAFTEPSIYPRDPALRAECRLLEDLADTQLDAATYTVAVLEHGRGERNPTLQEATRRDLDRLYAELEGRLADRPFFCGEFSLADIAIAPHIMAAAFLGFPLDLAKHSRLTRWMERVQERESIVRDNTDVFASLQRLQEEGGGPGFDPYRVQWRSDRLEWVIKNGFADWFMAEMRAGRAFFPLTTPTSTST